MSQKFRCSASGIFYSIPRLSLVALAVASVSQVHAARFDIGDVSVTVDSEISAGASWRTEDRNPDYIARGTLNAQGDTTNMNPSFQGHSSSNTDDGNMNFDKGDTFSRVIKGDHAFRFTHSEYRNVGVNISFRYWYDDALASASSPSDADMVDDWEDTAAFDEAESGIELMDGYVWMDFDLAGRPGQAVLGRQVLNWGESTFIQGGQNVANPVDVPALRRPGAQIRDALLPVNMLSASLALDEMGYFTVQGYYQLEWRRTRVDACGTYFSNNDFAAEGCGPVYYQSGQTEQENLQGQHGVPGLPPGEDMTIANRTSDDEPGSSGQYGLAFKWYVEALNGTELGLSFQNFHYSVPYASGVLSEGSATGAAIHAGSGGNFGNDTPGDPSVYRIEFPESQEVFGLSFASLLPSGTAWSGELTYRPDALVQVNANDILVRGLLGNMGYDPDNATHNDTTIAGNPYASLIPRLPSEIREWEAGEQKGYRELDIYQFQTTFLHDINQVLGAENFRVIGEVGVTYVNDLPETDQMRFGRSSIYGSWGAFQADAESAAPDPSKVFADNGYVTDISWGYRLLAQLSYPNAFVGGLTLKPTLFWSHDVKGYGPEPASQFYEGRKIVGTTLGAEYQNMYFANISYNHYFDTDYWDLDDRNYVSLSVGVNF